MVNHTVYEPRNPWILVGDRGFGLWRPLSVGQTVLNRIQGDLAPSQDQTSFRLKIRPPSSFMLKVAHYGCVRILGLMIEQNHS
jgi:hypothetical protein